MSAVAWRWIWQRPASPSDLWRLAQIAGTSSSRSPSALAGWWHRPTDRRILTLPEAARFYCSGPSQVRRFGTANQRQRQATKRHLYQVLDDQWKDYSIYKLDMDNDPDEGRGSLETPLSLLKPPALRIGPPTIGLGAQFAALGSHIIATHPATDAIPRVRQAEPRVTLTYDTKTDLIGVSNIFPEELRTRYETAIAVRNKLCVFESHTFNKTCRREGSIFGFLGGLHCLATDPSNDERDWTWRPLSDSSRFSWSWTSDPPEFPFDPKIIIVHVVHPRTGTIFVFVGGRVRGTFSYGTGGSGQWKRAGDWMFPFKGKAHYDNVLGAWVGLRFHRRLAIIGNGYLCACFVMSGWQLPKWKVGREKLFIEHPHWIHVDAKLVLVHMGEHDKYCLVERLLPQGAEKLKCVLRLTMFIVKYGDDGELRTMAHQPSRFYKARSYHPRFDVQAFWM